MHHSVVEGANQVYARNLARTHFSLIDAFQIRSKKNPSATTVLTNFGAGVLSANYLLYYIILTYLFSCIACPGGSVAMATILARCYRISFLCYANIVTHCCVFFLEPVCYKTLLIVSLLSSYLVERKSFFLL